MGTSENAIKLLRAEADLYRKTLIGLNCMAMGYTNNRRKTVDKTSIADTTAAALEAGNELFRRAKATADE